MGSVLAVAVAAAAAGSASAVAVAAAVKGAAVGAEEEAVEPCGSSCSKEDDDVHRILRETDRGRSRTQ